MKLLEQRDQKMRADEVRKKESISQNLGFTLSEVGRHWKVERQKTDLSNLYLLKKPMFHDPPNLVLGY